MKTFLLATVLAVAAINLPAIAGSLQRAQTHHCHR